MKRDYGRNMPLSEETSKMSERNKVQGLFKKKSIMVAAIAIAAGLLGLSVLRFTTWKGDIGPGNDHPTFSVMRGPLRINVVESGTIKAREQLIIKNEVEGKTSIIYLIPEGTQVEKGQLLVELDASGLLDQKIDQQIKVQNMEAAFVGAREDLEVVKNQAQADVDKARLAYDFAKEDLKKYQEGEYPNQLKEAESKLTLAKEEATRAQEKVEWSRRLFKEKYISETELEADELTLKRKELDVELARNNLDLLKNYTHKRNMAQLESDVKQAKMALDRTVRKAKADVVQAEANLEAKKAEFERQKDKLKKIEMQIEKTKIYAPAEGQVIHATSVSGGGPRWRGTTQPLEEGQEVRERQELIYLPTTSSAKVEVAIHEANLDKVRIGLPVKVTVDALPGETFWGKVARIAPLPDAQSAWLNPDLKVYNTDIYLEGNSVVLRTGMSCKAEIIIEQHEEATYIPIQAVLRVGGKPTVYVVKGNDLEPRAVEIGLDNNRMVRIISGLEPGEVVSLTPPLAAAAVEPTEYSNDIKKESIPVKTQTKPAPGTIGQGSGSGQKLEKSSPAQEMPIKGQGLQSSSGPRLSGESALSPEEQKKRDERLQSMSPEQIERMRQFFKSLSPEERERFRNMSPEEKRRFRQERMGR
jgi:HlyD family secretion protein